MAQIYVLAPHMWGRRIALHPLQSPAKLMGQKLILMVILAIFRAFWPDFSVFGAIIRVLGQKLTLLFLFIRYLNYPWKPGSYEWSFAGVKRILRQDMASGKVEKKNVRPRLRHRRAFYDANGYPQGVSSNPC